MNTSFETRSVRKLLLDKSTGVSENIERKKNSPEKDDFKSLYGRITYKRRL